MPKKTNKVINVAKYMPQIKNVAKRQLIIGQLDQLKSNLDNVKVSNEEKPTHCGSHTRFIKSCHQCIAITQA